MPFGVVLIGAGDADVCGADLFRQALLGREVDGLTPEAAGDGLALVVEFVLAAGMLHTLGLQAGAHRNVTLGARLEKYAEDKWGTIVQQNSGSTA